MFIGYSRSRNDYPCPEAADIAPCDCIYTSGNVTLDLNCRRLEGLSELDAVFGAEFPFDKYNIFLLENSKIHNIPAGIFRTIFFEWVLFQTITSECYNFYTHCKYCITKNIIYILCTLRLEITLLVLTNGSPSHILQEASRWSHRSLKSQSLQLAYTPMHLVGL